MPRSDELAFAAVLAEPLRNGLTRPKAVRGNGVKMVNMGELFKHPRLTNAPMDRVPLSPKEAESYLLAEGDLLFARQSLVLDGAGKCSIFLGDTEPVTWEGHIIRARPDKAQADPLFYYYFFSSPLGRQAIESIVEQVAAAGIRGSDLARLKVPFPPLPEQREIALILCSLDDKIELNRRMNETLEAMARALFKCWFVDFEPVRIKQAARLRGAEPNAALCAPPSQGGLGLSPDLAALFPDSFTDSPLGEIPVGWRVSTIGEETTVVGGSTPSTTEPAFWEGGTHNWATPKDLSPLTFPVLLGTERQITDAGLAKISSGLLPQGTVLLSSRAPIGYLAIAESPVAINQGFIAMKCDKSLPNHYVLRWAEHFMEDIKGQSNGTTFMEVSKSSFRPLRLVVPNDELLKVFFESSSAWHNQMVSNELESWKLAEIRDALLPKLITGEVRV